jgi:hypothetical protein
LTPRNRGKFPICAVALNNCPKHKIWTIIPSLIESRIRGASQFRLHV